MKNTASKGMLPTGLYETIKGFILNGLRNQSKYKHLNIIMIKISKSDPRIVEVDWIGKQSQKYNILLSLSLKSSAVL